ncbi:MAG: hypothetical protein WDZ72_05310, partial [Cyclobacteriaceae bacterium]
MAHLLLRIYGIMPIKYGKNYLQIDQQKKMKNWTLVIKPKTSWFDLHLHDLWTYRDLLLMFVKRDFISVYKQ